MKKIIALLFALVPVLAIAQENTGMTSLVTDSTKIDAVPTLSDADSAYIQGDYRQQ